MSKTYLNLFLSLLSAVVLSLSWPDYGLQILVFASLIPLLVLFERLGKDKVKGWKVFLYYFLCFLIWNSLTTWWVANASLAGAMLAIGLNSLFMALIVRLAYQFQLQSGLKRGVITWVLFWISFEFIHYRWELIWPWLNLGNVFASEPEWVQFYEVTGVLGGSLWIWLVNIGIWLLFRSMFTHQQHLMSKGFAMLGVIILPLLWSWLLHSRVDISEGKKIKVLVVQPNIDAYSEKYSLSLERQISKFIRLADTKMDSSVRLVIGPETMIPTGIWQEQARYSSAIRMLKTWQQKWPKANLLIGGTTYKRYYNEQLKSPSARFNPSGKFYYDVYNSALFLAANDDFEMYHKSKLVPGVEQMPYDEILKPLQSLAIDMGGSSGTLGTQDEPSVFHLGQGDSLAPAICYESVCGEHLGNFVKQGANLIAVITNDDWWGDTPGYRQHFEYARLRAVESRRWIVRSANTGISGVIDPLGRTYKRTKYKFDKVFKREVFLRDTETYYVKHGDFIGRWAAWISLLYLIYFILRLAISKLNR